MNTMIPATEVRKGQRLYVHGFNDTVANVELHADGTATVRLNSSKEATGSHFLLTGGSRPTLLELAQKDAKDFGADVEDSKLEAYVNNYLTAAPLAALLHDLTKLGKVSLLEDPDGWAQQSVQCNAVKREVLRRFADIEDQAEGRS